MNEYYKQQLEKGLQYQDYVIEKLYNIGIPIISYCSKEYQGKGENKGGFEIKFDDKFKQTGNLYIETAEKSDPKNSVFVSSGIYRNDNTWIYIIGNYEKLFMFPKKYLIELHKRGQFREVETETSKGYLLPYEYAKLYAAKIIKGGDPQ